MKTVYKYKLPTTPAVVKLNLPFGYRILTTAMQGDELVFWCLVDSDEKVMIEVIVQVAYTGDEIQSSTPHYIGTVQYNELVYHVFELPVLPF